jgi:hypothetical protein
MEVAMGLSPRPCLIALRRRSLAVTDEVDWEADWIDLGGEG